MYFYQKNIFVLDILQYYKKRFINTIYFKFLVSHYWNGKISKTHISIKQRARICLLIEQGYSTRKVGEIEHVGHLSVARIIKKRRETGSLNNKTKSGHLRIFKGRDKKKVIHLLKSNECKTAIDIQRKLLTDYNMKVSADTI